MYSNHDRTPDPGSNSDRGPDPGLNNDRDRDRIRADPGPGLKT